MSCGALSVVVMVIGDVGGGTMGFAVELGTAAAVVGDCLGSPIREGSGFERLK